MNPVQSSTITVKLVSSQCLIAELFCRHINELPNYTAFWVEPGEAPLIKGHQDTQSDIAIFDIPRIDFEAQKTVEVFMEANEHVKCIALTGSGIKQVAEDFFNAGLSAYILYSTPLNSVKFILDLVITGEKFMPEDLRHRVSGEANFFAASLNENELAMLRFLSEGLNNKEIARLIGKSEVTVKLYMSNLFAKVGARSRTHAMVIAYRNGFR